MPSNDFDRCKQGTTVQGTLLLHYQTRKILVQQLQTSKKAKEAYLLCLGWGRGKTKMAAILYNAIVFNYIHVCI